MYKWTLERIISTNNSNTIEIDYFPSSSENGLIQTLKTEIITKLNSCNVFDFDYIPFEKDYLNITNQKNEDEYLNLIFLEGIWIEEKHLNDLRNPNLDNYKTLEIGDLELQ
ncbi:hypothetical protein [Tenacibaculum sp. 190524A05c]|uniref:hypothetical protein n=1 Tax=Tenacibaculum platacis TaxID=3137852 RepID=UPI0032B22A40